MLGLTLKEERTSACSLMIWGTEMGTGVTLCIHCTSVHRLLGILLTGLAYFNPWYPRAPPGVAMVTALGTITPAFVVGDDGRTRWREIAEETAEDENEDDDDDDRVIMAAMMVAGLFPFSFGWFFLSLGLGGSVGVRGVVGKRKIYFVN